VPPLKFSTLDAVFIVTSEKQTWNFYLSFPPFGGTGFWTQGFSLARQAISPLNHSFSPFFSGCLRDRGSLFVQAGLDHDPPILHFPPLLEWETHATTPSPCLSQNLMNILPILASNCNPPHLSLWNNT
jgi:hypothetical protein